ncbi:hypothetical protein MPSEU_001064600 [Mayamaea pseudoterrestris]|nr:hypothetical protein MPSEU_001064600 [Mayamaea pseudoterrestris]
MKSYSHDILYSEDSQKTEECSTKPLTKEQAQAFANAIQRRWFYQMYLDDLPLGEWVGELLPSSEARRLRVKDKDDKDRLDHVSEVEDIGDLHPFVYTTRNLVVTYNGDNIVQVDLTSDPASLVKVEEGVILKFTMHVKWNKSTDLFHSRF